MIIPIGTDYSDFIRSYRLEYVAILVELKDKAETESSEETCNRPRESEESIIVATWQSPTESIKEIRVLLNSGGLWTDLKLTQTDKANGNSKFIECDLIDTDVVTKFDTECVLQMPSEPMSKSYFAKIEMFQGSRRGSGASKGDDLPIRLPDDTN